MAANSSDFFHRRTFCVITGASKGLGRAIALRFAECFADSSLLLLLSRNDQLLHQTKSLIVERCPKLNVALKSLDLAKPDADELDSILKGALREHGIASAGDFEQAVVVHNAGSTGDVSKWTRQMKDVEEWRNYMDLNLHSVVCLNSVFLNIFTQDQVKQRLVINITSLAAFHPFKSWGFYCTGKAAREMFFRVLAAEDPSLRVLNYAPGPLKTEMTVKIREESADDEIRQWMKDAYDQDRMLDVDFTVARLIECLKLNKFKNGDHVDVEDLVVNSKAVVSS